MTSPDFTALLPLLIIAISSIVVLLQISFSRNSYITYLLTCFALVIAFISLFWSAANTPTQVTSLIVIDKFALFLMGLFFLSAIVVAILGYNYLKLFSEERSIFYIALLLAVLGSCVLVSSSHFVALFLGLEILTVSLYIMIAYLRQAEFALESGMKYLILAGASSAFLLLGIALIYAETGSMNFREIATFAAGANSLRGFYILTGISLFLVGIGFKLAVVPFHMWTPDVYEGAPAPVTAFIATISKGAVFGVLLRFFLMVGGQNYPSVMLVISVIAVASMFLGNLLALLQNNIKRILAYSSISHLGYMLVALVAGGNLAVRAVLYYLVIYFATTLAAFGIISLLSDKDGEKMAISDYRGLFWRQPRLAVAFTATLLSLAGIPLTAGFVGKFFIFMAGINSSLYALIIILVINSAIGLFYYLRILTALYARPENQEAPIPINPQLSPGGGITLTILTIAILYFGVFPAPLLRLISSIVNDLSTYIAT